MNKLFTAEKQSNIDVEKNKKLFIDLFEKFIKRDGADKLLKFLKKSDFFTAPASTKFHGNYTGGLCVHSMNVLSELLKELGYDTIDNLNQIQVSSDEVHRLESIVICALLHDLCKVNFYKVGQRNVKDENGTWKSIKTYEIEDKLPFGHGEKSVYIIQSYMNLTQEEAVAIRWHMGDFNEAYGACSKAYDEYPLALYLHIADLKASKLYEPTFDYISNSWKKE